MYNTAKPGTLKYVINEMNLKFKRMSPSRFLVLGFLVIILAGAFLLMLPVSNADGEMQGFVDALFTATSATCVTGLVVVDTALNYTRFGQLVILVLIQVGGLGFMSMATMIFILLGRCIGLRSRLLLQESFNKFSMQGLVRLTKTVLSLTLFIEGIGALLLYFRFEPLLPTGEAMFYGLFHSVSAFCNAGFDLFGKVSGPFSSLSSFTNDAFVQLVIGALIIVGGIGFPVLAEIITYRSNKNYHISIHTRLVVLITSILLATGAIAVFALEYGNPDTLKDVPLFYKITNSVFMSITPRTAGFNILQIGSLRGPTVLVIMMLMFIGASPSSTGGGIKTVTAGVLVMSLLATIKGDENVEYHERRIPKDQVMRAISVILLSAGIVLAGIFLMTVFEDKSLLDMLFEVISAFATVGLSRGITPELGVMSRLLLVVIMLMGRLGPLTFAVALNYRKTASKVKVSFPEEHVMIG